MFQAIADATIYPDGRFLMSNLEYSDYATCVNEGKYLIDQIVEADKCGETYAEVHSPMCTDGKLEWAYEDNYAHNVAATLYNHGVIRNKIEVNTIHDPVEDCWVSSFLFSLFPLSFPSFLPSFHPSFLPSSTPQGSQILPL